MEHTKTQHSVWAVYYSAWSTAHWTWKRICEFFSRLSFVFIHKLEWNKIINDNIMFKSTFNFQWLYGCYWYYYPIDIMLDVLVAELEVNIRITLFSKIGEHFWTMTIMPDTCD